MSSLLFSAIRCAEKEGQPPLAVGRAFVSLGLLFAEARLVAWPLTLCALLSALPSDTPVRYDLTEGVLEFDATDEDSAKEFVDTYWLETGETIAGYAQQLGLLYGALAAFQSNLGRAFWFGRAASALGRLEELNLTRNESNRKARGDALEDLVAALVQIESPELVLVEKNFRTREEEIDLVLTNALPSPFWTAFGSPAMLVECKNTATKVGIQPLRVFESKMDDRGALVRIGIFVSMSGFAKTFLDRLKNIQKDGGIIFAVSGEDLRYLVEKRVRLSDWLSQDGFLRALSKQK